MSRRVLIGSLFSAMLLLSATYTSAQNQDNTAAFTLPSIPSTITEPAKRAEYLVAHYWDDFDFSNSALINRTEITEQAFVDFIDILPYVSYENATDALTDLLKRASIDDKMIAYFAELSEKYLYETSSPFCNDEYYIPVLQYLVANFDDADRLRFAYQLEMAVKNRLGSTANDFTYTLKDDSRGTLHTIVADYTLLFFNNPDCAECVKAKNAIANSRVINKLLNADGSAADSCKLVVLSFYTETDIPLWLDAKYPHQWLNAYDAEQSVNKQQLYDLKTLPTIYLLDSDKRVILKNASVEAVEAWLEEIPNRH